MGEVVVSSEDVERKTSEAAPEQRVDSDAVGGHVYRENKEASSSAKHGLSKWEKFLPKMALRVLLVEADDSTRQIVTALLRKCRYRVAAVSDGLKAWEMLRDKPRNVDLILTEVELPSISGYALLTLVMEHEICKNIPVIMMSRQDNVTTVYRCMLRGAVDYLVKPIRRNELRNLWQHVWRRRSCLEGGKAHQEYRSVVREKVEGTSENNPASNHSSGNKTCVERSTEYVDKAEYVDKESDEQSSCTKPDLEAEGARMEDFSGKSFPDESCKHGVFINFSQKEQMLESNGEAHVPPVHMSFESKDQGKDRNVSAETSNSLTDFPRVAIDFMGTSYNHEPSAIDVRSNLDSLAELNLSLRRSPTTSAENQGAKECPTLWHPKASAFTRYISKQMQDPCTLFTSLTDQNKECGSNANRTDCSSDTPSPTLTTQKSRISQATSQSKQSEVGGSCPQGSICPAPVPAKVISLNLPHNGYNFGVVPVLSMQSNPSSVLTPNSANPQQSFFHMNQHYHSAFESVNSGKFYDQSARDANCSATQPFCKPEKHPNGLLDMGLVPPANDQSMNSSLCNGSMSQLNNIGFGSACGSNSNPDQAAAVGNSAESKNEDSLLCQGGSLSRSTQREAALMKFRLKRKDRCFEKKVRYESRKKLAEQRPRVKGQFVRQGQNE